jgi:hypothetical protein
LENAAQKAQLESLRQAESDVWFFNIDSASHNFNFWHTVLSMSYMSTISSALLICLRIVQYTQSL